MQPRRSTERDLVSTEREQKKEFKTHAKEVEQAVQESLVDPVRDELTELRLEDPQKSIVKLQKRLEELERMIPMEVEKAGMCHLCKSIATET